MNVKEAVKYVSSKFKYKSDSKWLVDQWFVMKDKDGVMSGDCDDFSITSLWYICDKNIWKFIWHVLITHRYRMYKVITSGGEPHLVGYAEGLWFDNWSLEALPKEDFFNKTSHKIKFFVLGPVIAIFLLAGLFKR